MPLPIDEVLPFGPSPEPAVPADQLTPPAPKAFTFDALTAIGQHAKAVCEQTDVVRAIEAEMYRFESENAAILSAHGNLRTKLADARHVLARRREDAFNEIGWQVRK